MPVDELAIYTASLKDGMVGLRWNYLNNENISEFIVSCEDASTKTKIITIINPSSNKCSAWPKYYCYTFYKLKLSNFSAIFKVRIKYHIFYIYIVLIFNNKVINKCIAITFKIYFFIR